MSDFNAHLAKADALIAKHVGQLCNYLTAAGDSQPVDVLIVGALEDIGGEYRLSVNEYIAEMPLRAWERGEEIVVVATGARYRIHGIFDQDSSWLRLQVAPVSDYDLQDIQESDSILDNVVNGEW